MSKNLINIRIEKLAPLGSKSRISMEYTDSGNNGEYVAIGTDKQRLTKDQVEKERIPVFAIDFPIGQKFRDFVFNLDDPKDKLLYDKLCQNPFVDCPINKNKKYIQYKLSDINEKENQDVVKVKQISAAIEYIRGVSKKSMYEIGYYLGADYSKKTPNQVFLALVGITDGLIHKAGNWERVQNMETDPQGRMKLCINKAMVAGILSMKGDGYYYKGDYTGSTKEEVLFYFQTNTSIFENGLWFDVSKWDEVQPISVANEEDEATAKVIEFQNSETKRHLETETDMEELLKYAEENGFRGHAHWKPETLRAKVADHKKREADKLAAEKKKKEVLG